jgi:lysine-N-methylase
MALSVVTLPIVEHWDCHGCGNCCRSTIIPLNDVDLRKLREQKWYGR